MLNLRRQLKIVCVILVCCLCVACAADGLNLRQTNKLLLYCPEYLSDMIRTAISLFQEKFPNVEIENKLCSNDVAEYSQLLRTEVMAGKGPDLILFGDYEFQDTEKAMDAGIFYNIDSFLTSDDSFDISKYHPSIFNGGYYKNERLYIPLCYYAMDAVTTNETRASFGVDLTEISSFEDWMHEFLEWQSKNTTDERVLTNCSTETPYFYSTYFGVRYINLETGEILIDQNEFKLFMDFLKVKFPKLEYGFADPRFSTNLKLVEAIRNDELLFHIYMMHQDWNLGIYQALSENRTAQSLILPSMGSEQPLATGRIMAAINNGGSNKVNAYEFLKILLSTEVQSQPGYPIPVNNEALEYQLKLLTAQYGFADDEMDRMYADFQSLGYIHPLSYTQYALFEDSMRPWFLDEKSYEDCLEDFRNRLEIFIDE